VPDARIYVVEETVHVVEVDSGAIVVEIGTSGPQGPAGQDGFATVSDISHIHTQSVPSNQWLINHNLSFYPNITVVDSSGNVVEGSYTYQDENTIITSFSGAFSGKAYLS
jgi:hypothetical protein